MTVNFSLAGLLVGILVGTTGVGGGSVMTPMLTAGFGVPPAIAVGTDLVFAALTKTAGTAVHRLQDSVDWRVTRLLCTGSLPAAALTVAVLAAIGVNSKSAAIEIGLAIALLGTATLMLLGNRAESVVRRYRPTRGSASALVTIGCGFVLGAMVTLTSVGAGARGATMLLTLYPQMRAVRIAGTDIAHAVPLATVAGIGHMWLGAVDFSLLTGLLVGSIPGIALGAVIGKRLPDRLLRRVLAFTLIAVALFLLLKRI